MSELVVGNAGLVVTMDGSRRVLERAAVACRDGRIVAIGDDDEIRGAHPDATLLDALGGWVTPGYVNAHQHHTGDRLARCTIPDHIASNEAIFEWAVPLHSHHEPADDELSALASATEQLRNGVTCVVEAGTVAHPDRVAAALQSAGMRGTVGTWGWDTDGLPFSAPPAEVLARQRDVLDRHPRGSLVEGWVTLVGHDLMSDELLVGASALAVERATGLTFHQSPTPADASAWRARTGASPLAHFARLGALGPHVLVAHAVHLDDEEIDVLLDTGTAVASCPWAYLRLAQGFTAAGRHAELIARGGRVALGCDSENAGDQVDVLRAAALFAGIVRDRAMDPTAFLAVDAFALATCDGAAAIGRRDLGAVEVGRAADLVVHDASTPAFTPAGGDPYVQLVWGTDGRSVRHVVVDGRVVVQDRRCTLVDEVALRAEVAERRRSLLARAGLG
jgi:5-methylthioadenosine/S-adenosylhomocysteine deaminase